MKYIRTSLFGSGSGGGYPHAKSKNVVVKWCYFSISAEIEIFAKHFLKISAKNWGKIIFHREFWRNFKQFLKTSYFPLIWSYIFEKFAGLGIGSPPPKCKLMHFRIYLAKSLRNIRKNFEQNYKLSVKKSKNLFAIIVCYFCEKFWNLCFPGTNSQENKVFKNFHKNNKLLLQTNFWIFYRKFVRGIPRIPPEKIPASGTD